MKLKIITAAILKVLDIVHDVLCPYFNDDVQKNKKMEKKKKHYMNHNL